MAIDNLLGSTRRVVEETEPLNNCRGVTYRVVNVDGGGGSVDYTKVVSKTDSMPTAGSDNANYIYLYDGETDATYTHGYIYENVPTTTSSSASASQTVGSGLSDIAVDLETLESFTGWTTDNSLQIFYTDDGWSVDTTSLGITYTGTPSVGDAITVVYTAPVTTYAWVRIDTQPEGVQMSVPTAPTLAVADWSSNTQTVTVNGVTASNTVIVSPAPASAVEYAACGILCTTQGTDSLTFTCTAVPANALTVNVVILN